MADTFVGLLSYIGQLLLLTLGVVVVCGLAVRLCARLFSALMGGGSDTVFDVTSIIGTPVHELGHAIMCPLFGHKISKIKLWSPTAKNGVYGFVEHSYNRKNPWAQLGNLLIGLGPIFSGLGVTVLMLWLCFPSQWGAYLQSSKALVASETELGAVAAEVMSLITSLPQSFTQGFWRPFLGLVIILPISLHISLSAADIKGSLGALPWYLLLVTVFASVTYFLNVSTPIMTALRLLNLRLLSLFCVVVAFAVLWVLLALLIRLICLLIRCF